jgi:poly-gamma-glutamate synthesis protein (capsule biosynthesis protein)
LREATLVDQVRAAKSRANVVMVSLHWGVEYRATPTPAQKALARALWAAGADVIFGHHSHVLGPIEEARLGGRRRLVAYSLGNLIFDPPRWEPRASQSMLLRVVLGADGLLAWRKIPLLIRNCRPEPLAGAAAST